MTLSRPLLVLAVLSVLLIGFTTKGTLMCCTRKAGEDRARWRAA